MALINQQIQTELRQISGEVWDERMDEFYKKIVQNLPKLLNLLGYEERLLSAEEACQLLNISKATLDTYRSNKDLPYVPGRPCKYKRSELLEWRDKQSGLSSLQLFYPELIQEQIKAILF